LCCRSLAFGLLLVAPTLLAHPISILLSDAVVHRGRMEIKVAVMPEDLVLMHGLFADAGLRYPTNDLASAATLHGRFLLESLIVRDGEGKTLQGKAVSFEMPALPAAGLPYADLMATSIVFHLEYSVSEAPARLSFQLHGGSSASPLPTIMYLKVAREGLPPEPPFHLTSDENIETVSIDWNRPAQPTPSGQSPVGTIEGENWKQDLGMSSYSDIYSFVYIQNEEVRAEILLPLLTLEMWHPVARTNSQFIEVSEQRAARTGLEDFLIGQNELQIDGAVVKPRLERLAFYGVDSRDFAARAEPRRLMAATARVGAILTYPAKGVPRHIELKWTFFNNRVLAARTTIFAFDKASQFTFFPRTPVFKWDNPGTAARPAITAISTSEQSHEAIVKSLLNNLYRSFEYRSDSDIYDALARSVHGDLLTDLYLKIKQSLIMQDQDGAVAHVQTVNVVKNEPLNTRSRSGFGTRITWQIEGTVEHWGHLHTRVNEYSADLTIEPVDAAWKITAMNVTRQSLVKSAALLRRL
jgi:hypothetical protein